MDQERVPRVRRAEVRQQLIHAAARVFGTKGIDASRLDDVAAEAGFTRGAVYSNFSNKDDLITALITERIVGKINENLATVFPGDDDKPLPLRAGELLAGQIRDDHCGQLLVLEFLTRAARDPETRARFIGPRREQRRMIAEALRDHAEQRGVELPLSPDLLALIVLGLVNGIAAEYMADPDDVSLEALPAALNAFWPA